MNIITAIVVMFLFFILGFSCVPFFFPIIAVYIEWLEKKGEEVAKKLKGEL